MVPHHEKRSGAVSYRRPESLNPRKLGLAVALLGLMVGPLLQHIRFGYWSPVSLLFGAVLPSVAMAASTLVAAVLGRALVVSLGANERIQVALAKTDTATAEGGGVQAVPDGQDDTDDSQGQSLG